MLTSIASYAMTAPGKTAMTAMLLGCHLSLWSQGMPFFRNFASTEYAAHNQNFDIVADDDGTVYVANFEGLLYYDNAQWRIIHTPGITRVTKLYRDSRGTLWTGGYNYIGRLETDPKGILRLKAINHGEPPLRGEVMKIWETQGRMFMRMSDGRHYSLGDSTVAPANEVASHSDEQPAPEAHHPPSAELGHGITAMAIKGEGVVINDKDGNELFHMTEDNGLCSNNVSSLAYNGHGMLWAATDNGIVAIAVPSAYTHFTSYEGLRDEVLSIAQMQGSVYAGTSGGLYHLQGTRFLPVQPVELACWQLQPQPDRLLAATATGLYAVGRNNKVQPVTTGNTLSVYSAGDVLLTGEIDGVYVLRNGKEHKKTWNIEKVVRMVADDNGRLWLQNLYGKIWHTTLASVISPHSTHPTPPVPYEGDDEEIRTLVVYKGQVTPITTSPAPHLPTSTTPQFPLFSYADEQGLLWLTDNKGKCPYAMSGGGVDEKMSRLVYPLMDYSVRTMMRWGNQLWMGGDKGINIVDDSRPDPASNYIPRLMLRAVMLYGDSVIWGGYGQQPEMLPAFANHENKITFYYSTDTPSLLLATQYRTRLNGGVWSAWETLTYEEYNNLTHGSYRFEVQARDAYGRLSEIVAIKFSIEPPFYLRWYMVLLYIVLLAATIFALVIFRLHQLEKDKHRLEAIVSERTADLIKAQHELVRQEKMATVGKLTKGLIDRILNPLNYINNFAKLSESLVDDAMANIEDEKANMSPDNYDDTVDVLSMLRGNLQKVGEHGASTSRILKSMEEMLKDRTGGQVGMSLTHMLRHDEEMLHKYYGKEIAACNISTLFTLPAEQVNIKGNADLLSMTVMSLLRNAVYAVMKKHKRMQADAHSQSYRPEVTVNLTTDKGKAIITLHDNGTGIESNIIDRIFDPFFTTKTTAEASGMGLYISREVAQNHGGDITVASVKDEYTEFTITLPLHNLPPATTT